MDAEKNPKISVITVCFNAENEIEKTILSVLSQSYDNIEYVIIDGGSKDKTVEIIKRYNKKIDIFLSEPDKGIYDAMNKGAKLSHGKWLNFMNAGDVFFDENVLKNIVKQGPFNSRVKVLYGNVHMLYKGQEGIVKKLDRVKKNEVQYSLNHQSTLIEGEWMRSKRYDTTYRIAADANFFNETVKAGYLFQYVPVTISSYESTEGVSAVNQILLFQEMMQIKEIRKWSYLWIKGYMRAKVFGLIHQLPYGIGESIMAFYVKKRVG